MTQNLGEETQRSSIDSERHGLLGRVIENWLTSVNERQYQLPFCQVLAADGETILYISSHGPFEKGKDVITRTSSGELRAYQLKAGDISLSTWREIYGEVVNLVELAIELPGRATEVDFVPFLVTNGEVTDPVIEQIRVANATWKARGVNKTLQLIQRGELFERFRASHGAYLPHLLEDFRTFLELVLRDGAAPADKEKAAQLIEHILPDKPDQKSALDVARAATSITLLAAYISGPAARASNHWCAFEYWILAGAYVLHLAEKSGKAELQCRVSFEISEMAAKSALDSLAAECEQCANLVQGHPLVDGHTYRARVTILAGLLSALDLWLRIRQMPNTKREWIRSFLSLRLKETAMWGESAVPHLFLAALEAEQNCLPQIAEGIAIQLVREISGANGLSATGRGVPNPYYSPEAAMRLGYGLDQLNSEQFLGLSYTIAPLLEFLARRWRRQAIASFWFDITRISLVHFVPATPADWFRWNSSDGLLESKMPGEPQSWRELRTKSEQMGTEGLPRTLVERPAFALWFVLVYPHRFTPALVKLIESAIWKAES
jgi:hypothetical protein